MNSRIFNILETLDLKSRLIFDEMITSIQVNLNVDYNKAHEILKMERDKSLSFLEKSLHL
jgi:hypothetical protein